MMYEKISNHHKCVETKVLTWDDLRDTNVWFILYRISDVLVDESKLHVSSEYACDEIRRLLSKIPTRSIDDDV